MNANDFYQIWCRSEEFWKIPTGDNVWLHFAEAFAASETAAKESAEAERDRAVRALKEASIVITNACQIIDVTKIEWGSAWSDWDQSVRDAASEWLKSFYAEATCDACGKPVVKPHELCEECSGGPS